MTQFFINYLIILKILDHRDEIIDVSTQAVNESILESMLHKVNTLTLLYSIIYDTDLMKLSTYTQLVLILEFQELQLIITNTLFFGVY